MTWLTLILASSSCSLLLISTCILLLSSSLSLHKLCVYLFTVFTEYVIGFSIVLAWNLTYNLRKKEGNLAKYRIISLQLICCTILSLMAHFGGINTMIWTGHQNYNLRLKTLKHWVLFGLIYWVLFGLIHWVLFGLICALGTFRVFETRKPSSLGYDGKCAL